jgi:hypothetical protein
MANYTAESKRYIKQEPYVGEDGIYVPIDTYAPEGTESMYVRIMTKKMFIEAYHKWIKPQYDIYTPSYHHDDEADCWCE